MSAKPQNNASSEVQLKYDVVKFDGRLKEVVHLEKLTRKQWEKKWGFMGNFMKIYQEEAAGQGINLENQSSRPLSISKAPFKVQPSPPVPRTSSGYVGWRSSIPECILERVGPLYVSPTSTIEPPENIPPCKQIHIFVG